jgi:hypothetical protein
MQPRLFAFAAAFRGSAPLNRGFRPAVRFRLNDFVCRSCQKKFSTSPTLRWFGQSSKTAGKTVEKERSTPNQVGLLDSVVLMRLSEYKSRLLIYDAGDTRTTWISFWKAMALLQFGTTLVFGVPPLWNNENQPDPNVRKMQAILGMGLYCRSPISLPSSKSFTLLLNHHRLRLRGTIIKLSHRYHLSWILLSLREETPFSATLHSHSWI